ncbi:MAG: beta-lactamase family protein [Gemmatimonadetes bacterium]|nr:beta-lactamase family protein [Gemmatimonadota bacterium]
MRAYGLVALLVLARGTPLGGQQPSLRQDPDVATSLSVLESWIEVELKARNIPGLAMAIVHDQDVLWSRGFGFADVEKRIPTDPGTTLYRIGSLTKVFTSIAVMQLVEQGRLDLEDPVQAHLPWFRIKERFPDAPPITVRQLLTHTSGLPKESPFPYFTTFEFPTLEQIRQALAHQEPLFPPETTHHYSNLGLVLAGEVVAAVSGLPWREYVDRKILKPLGMTRSTAQPVGPEDGLATGYGYRGPDGSRRTFPRYDLGGLSAAGSVASTVEDLARFAAWQFRLLRRGPAEVLEAATLRRMQRVHWIQDSWTGGQGLGFFVRPWRAGTLVGHGGEIMGFLTAFQLSPDRRIAVIALTNANDQNPSVYVNQAFDLVVPEILEALEGKDGSPGNPDWQPYLGRYRDFWGEYQIAVLDGMLKIFLLNRDPAGAYCDLEPVSAHVFRFSSDGCGRYGETLTFQMAPDGSVSRVKYVENLLEPLR